MHTSQKLIKLLDKCAQQAKVNKAIKAINRVIQHYTSLLNVIIRPFNEGLFISLMVLSIMIVVALFLYVAQERQIKISSRVYRFE